jgi:hypothetical protein
LRNPFTIESGHWKSRWRKAVHITMHWLQACDSVRTSSGLLSAPGLILAVLDRLPNSPLQLSQNIHGGLMTMIFLMKTYIWEEDAAAAEITTL